ncbi:MAG: hypothetical protein U1F09_11030, partial [Steroidobacteraceae bacterium]
MFTGFRASGASSGFALGLCTGLIVASAGFLLVYGVPPSTTASVAPASASAAPVAHATSGSKVRAGSMEAATLALATRLS